MAGRISPVVLLPSDIRHVHVCGPHNPTEVLTLDRSTYPGAPDGWLAWRVSSASASLVERVTLNFMARLPDAGGMEMFLGSGWALWADSWEWPMSEQGQAVCTVNRAVLAQVLRDIAAHTGGTVERPLDDVG